MKSFISKPYKRDSYNASVASLSSQASQSQSQSSRSSKSSMASSLAQAKQATAAAWTSLKKTCKKTCTKKTPLSPRACSSVDNPFNDYTYRTDEPTRVGRLVHRLSGSRRSRYSAIDNSAHDMHESARSDSDDDCDIFSGQPFWAGREPSTAYSDKMTVVVTTEARAHGARYATAASYTPIDDEWYL